MNMKRALCVFLVSGVMMTSVAAGASAAPAPQAVCVAHDINYFKGVLEGGRNFAHVAVVSDAHTGGAGHFIAPRASNDDCP